MEAMFTLTCRAGRLSPAKDKRHDDIRIPRPSTRTTT